MPIYEYYCDKCKARFEALMSTTTARLQRCPKCDAKDPIKVVSSHAKTPAKWTVERQK